MKHKWHDEIVAWAGGAEIEWSFAGYIGSWKIATTPDWDCEKYDFRIKPTPKESEFAHIPYWLCCGSLDSHHHNTSCYEAKAGYPERCRFGTIAEHKKRMEKPTPKEPQYLYVYQNTGSREIHISKKTESNIYLEYIGKIPLIGVDDVHSNGSAD